MKNIYDVLRQKEQELQRVQREIEALRIAAPLLADDTDVETVPVKTAGSAAGRAVTAAAMSAADPGLGMPGIRQFP